MGNILAHCEVVNNTPKEAVILTYNYADTLQWYPYKMYIIRPSESKRVEAAPDLRGLKLCLQRKGKRSGVFLAENDQVVTVTAIKQLGMRDGNPKGLGEKVVDSVGAYYSKQKGEASTKEVDSSGLSETEKEELGITPYLIEFVDNVSKHPLTFLEFPLDDDAKPEPVEATNITNEKRLSASFYLPSEDLGYLDSRVVVDTEAMSKSTETEKEEPNQSPHVVVVIHSSSAPSQDLASTIPEEQREEGNNTKEKEQKQGDTAPNNHASKQDDFEFTPRQLKHAKAMLHLCPNFQKIRNDLVPAKMKEDRFWRIYFELIKARTVGMDWSA